jgi:hypothetical protein
MVEVEILRASSSDALRMTVLAWGKRPRVAWMV